LIIVVAITVTCYGHLLAVTIYLFTCGAIYPPPHSFQHCNWIKWISTLSLITEKLSVLFFILPGPHMYQSQVRWTFCQWRIYR